MIQPVSASTASLVLPPPGQSSVAEVAGAAGPIEVALSMPAEAPRGAMLVAHPHPLFGGTMDNKVVQTLARAAVRNGYVAVRFNFRGVGGSGGVHDDGRGETDDAVQLAEQLSALLPALPLVLAGFSFGGFVLLRAAARLPTADVLTVAPPLSKYVRLPPPPRPSGRWWVIHGTADEVVSFAETRAKLLDYTPAPKLIEVPDVGHFFHGQLARIHQVVDAFLAD
ncbi:alpha/beta hydrolase [Flagellatimonas centrodinii]|uniref:alpha/beta hydrolase n=1 Tax=Flagellatimonas centrodinii TaxID=2806210 RepID=UPI001FEDCC03|nr:alpha/beta fold hydrolase [Flagellatimonas centrodinii]ULQ46797.1 alpha/beta hydrolase [Flagellatimonas centrodinii]